MNNIEDFEKVERLITTDNDKLKLKTGAALHKRHGGIRFKILKVGVGAITVQAKQYKHLTGHYLNQKELIQITKALFSGFLSEYEIHVHATACPENER